MADLKTMAPAQFLRDEELRKGIELLYFAYRDLVSDPDEALAEYGFGRAHHRVIHFVGRRPGMAVAELLDILSITKQSLSRVLGSLIDEGYVRQDKGSRDRRQRLLYLTDKGAELERQLHALQRDRVIRAYKEAGADAVAGFWRVLLGLTDPENRAAIQDFVSKS
ncbi:MarR family winged helix-turn-helix transcriptional regulator [Govanella unica]|uniref:MarR family transcriptional regulator n=1 Tax=Govanella unica TaxID=2975056 RepID=A0A9X3U0G1_9PROT|nr:MarR family transcriptional regulator [Govania unica]MDA5194782.1 MarR family transcriptional regulator [Govania unica]